MDEKQYSVGEIAALTGLSIRTLQHYDNIGLLPATGRTESGRRFYTAADIPRLEQILFYKLLGFSLKEIQGRLIPAESPTDLKDMLRSQVYLLLRKMDQLHTSFAALDASLKALDTGSLPPFEVVLQFIQLLPGEDVFEWAPALIEPQQREQLAQRFGSLEAAQSTYHALKGLLMDALVLSHAGVSPRHAAAQALARAWLELIQAISGGDPAALQPFAAIGQASEFGSLRGRKLMQGAFAFIQSAVEQLPAAPPAPPAAPDNPTGE